MKQMRKTILAVALLTTIFTGCSNDDSVTEVISNPVTPTTPTTPTTPVEPNANCMGKLRMVKVSILRNQDTLSDVTTTYLRNDIPNIIDAGNNDYFVGVKDLSECGAVKVMNINSVSKKYLYIDYRQ